MEITAHSVMRDEVVHLGPNDTVAAAAHLMRQACVGFLPICTSEDRVVGVLTDRDICMHMCEGGWDPNTVTVDSIMTRRLIGCAPSDSLAHVAELMEANHVCRVLVTDEQQRLCGVISLTDLAHVADPMTVARVVRRVLERELRVRHSDRPGPVSQP